VEIVSEQEAPKRQSFRRGWALVAGCITREPKRFALAVSGASLFALLTVAFSSALKNVVDNAIVPSFAPGGRRGSVVGPIVTFALIGFGRQLSVVLRRSQAGAWQETVAEIWRADVVNRYLAQPYAWIRKRHTGDLLSASDADPEAIKQFLAPLPASLGSIVLVVTAGIWLVNLDLVVGLFTATVLPIIAISNVIFVNKAEGPTERIQESVAQLSDTIHETVDGLSVIKILGARDVRRAQAETKINGLRAAKIVQLKLQVIFDAVLELFPALVTIALIVLGSWRVRAGAMTIGDVSSVVLLFSTLMWPLRMLAYTLSSLPRALAGEDRLKALLDGPLDPLPVLEVPTDDRVAAAVHGVGLVHADGRVALDDVSLTILRGERVAIVGTTASGKSTLLHVLAGIESATTGTVERGNGIDSALVFQEPLLFSGSIVENITVGRSIDGPTISVAVSQASAAEIVAALPDGMATIVGERGVTLSGGQRQRVALARALAGRPGLLLLDDTTSSLDPVTEASVLAALRDGDVAETVVLVAARPSSIALASRVVFLDNGRIMGSGTHDELIAKLPAYAELVSAYRLDEEASEGLAIDREGGRLRPNLVPPEPTPQAGTPGSSRSTNLPPSDAFAHDESSSAVMVEKPSRLVDGIKDGRLRPNLVPPDPTPRAATPVSGLGTNLEESSRSTNLPPSTAFAQDESSSAVMVEKPSQLALGMEMGGEDE
jgi:ATP-binding cassette, subfamily B, bacterial